MRILKLAACSALALTAAAAANATTIDFETFPGGGAVADRTPISTQYASLGVVFTGSNNGAPVFPVATDYAGGNPVSVGGTQIYEHNFLGNSNDGAPGNPRYDTISMLFTTPTDNISFGFNSFIFFAPINTTVNAYDATGNLLRSFIAKEGNGWGLVNVGVNGVSRLDFIANPYQGERYYFGIDHLNFSPTAAVPEPASWGMLLVGLGMIGGVMRQRAKVSRVTYA